MTKVLVWNEGLHEKKDPKVQEVYPEGIHGAIAGFLKQQADFTVKTATLDMPEHGLTEEALAETDVLIWWGHCHHHNVQDEIVDRVHKRVNDGMGLLVLHSAHASKIFAKLMGTNTWELRWREASELERVWTVDHSHPITKGIPEHFDIPNSEMYGERFAIPTPDELIFISWYEGGEVFRSGCTFKHGLGKIFFFAPGHESFPIYNMPEVQQIIINGVNWAAPQYRTDIKTGHSPEFVHKPSQ